MKYSLIVLLFLSMACSTSTHKAKHRLYQDRFYIGCMNAMIHSAEKYEKVRVDEEFLRKSADWCMAAYERIKNK